MKFTYTPAALVPGSLLTTSEVAYYTNSDTSDSRGAIIKEIWLNNMHTSDVTVEVHSIPLGSSSSGANTFIKAFNIPPNMPQWFSMNKVIAAGTSITAKASVTNVVSMSISGVEVTE